MLPWSLPQLTPFGKIRVYEGLGRLKCALPRRADVQDFDCFF